MLSTFASSEFLGASRAYNSGDSSRSDLIASITQAGLVNLIDALHIADQGELPKWFPLGKRRQGDDMRLTDAL